MPRAATTSDPFNAIAEPRRRHILEFIAAEERSVDDIADALELGAAVGVEAPAGAAATSASSRCGATAGRRSIGPTRKRCARFTTGAGCSRGTGADNCGASRHTRRKTMTTDDAPVSKTRRSRSPKKSPCARRSSRRSTSLVAQMGRLNETPDGTPLPMVIEPRPGGRWYRDLGGDNGHLWGFVQSIKRPTLLEIWGPLFMSTAATSNLLYRLTRNARRHVDHVHAHAGRTVPRRSSVAAGVGVDRAARARSRGRRSR